MPHALSISADGRITGSDRSRPQQADGSTGAGWVFVEPEQFEAAKAVANPTWDGKAVVDVAPAKPAMEIPAPLELDRPATAAELAALAARVERLEKAAGLGTDKTDEKDETAVAPPPAPSDLSVSSVASVSSVLPRAEATTP
jgi:hypothetical protein